MTNNHNILDVLTYMFDFIFEVSDSVNEIDDTLLKKELSQAGFDENGINEAFVWLDNITALQDGRTRTLTGGINSVRIYSQTEKQKIDAPSREFLHFMQNSGILSVTQREIIINQLMSLESDDLSIDDLKWVVMMILGNEAGTSSHQQWLEAVVFDPDSSKQ